MPFIDNTARQRTGLARLARSLALAAVGASVVLSPLRAHRLILAQPTPPVFREYTDLFVYPSDWALLAALGLWLASLLLAPRRPALGPRPLILGMVGLALAALLSVTASAAPVLSLYHAVRLVGLLAFALLLADAAPGLGFLAAAAGVLIITQAPVGIAQVMLQHSLGLAGLGELPLDPLWRGISTVWTPGFNSLRAYGLSDHPNLLGGCLALALVILAGGFLQARPAWRPPLAVVFGLGCAGLLVTFSRSAWLGLAGGLALLVGSLLVGRRKNDLLALAGLGAGAAVVLLPFLLAQAPLMASRLNLNRSFDMPTPENQAIGERGLLNAAAVQIFTRRPVTGVGVGAYPLAMAQQVPDYPLDYQPPHVVLLDVAVETGVPGAASYAALSLAPWALLFFQHRRRAPQRHVFSLPLWAATAALLAISLISLLDYYPWMLNPGRVWQWLIWGVWAGEYNRACVKEGHD